METTHGLSASLEETFRCNTRYALAVRAILLWATTVAGQRLGQRIHGSPRLDRLDQDRHPSLTRLSLVAFAASFRRATFAQIPKIVFPRRCAEPLGTRSTLDASGEFPADSRHY